MSLRRSASSRLTSLVIASWISIQVYQCHSKKQTVAKYLRKVIIFIFRFATNICDIRRRRTFVLRIADVYGVYEGITQRSGSSRDCRVIVWSRCAVSLGLAGRHKWMRVRNEGRGDFWHRLLSATPRKEQTISMRNPRGHSTRFPPISIILRLRYGQFVYIRAIALDFDVQFLRWGEIREGVPLTKLCVVQPSRLRVHSMFTNTP